MLVLLLTWLTIAFEYVFYALLVIGGLVFVYALIRPKVSIPQHQPVVCPNCQGVDHTYHAQGHSLCVDDQGIKHNVGFKYITCKHCETSIAQINNEPSYIPSDQEWLENTAPLKQVESKP